MLGRMLKYAGGAFAIQTSTGLLTYLADMTVAGVLTEQQYGEYRHYSLIYALGAGPFVVGIDHALVTYVNKHPENYARFLKIFLPYGALLVFLSFAAAIGVNFVPGLVRRVRPLPGKAPSRSVQQAAH